MLKKTKIIATISPRNCEIPFLKKMYDAGMNIVRLNTAHLDFETSGKLIQNVRAVSDKIAILIDTKGPEVRTTKSDYVLHVKHGDSVIVKGNPYGTTDSNCVYVSYTGFVSEITVGDHILIDDGSLDLMVKEKSGDALLCVAMNDGVIESRKSINVPGVNFNLPSLSPRDIEFIKFAVDNNLDFIAHSFVRNKEDVVAIQEILDQCKSKIKIIAKIENQQGVDHIDEILEMVHGVMVARGDLAIEIPFEKIPRIQKMLIKKCIAARKPVIIATQMLHSMITNPRPTRAEVNDVASAIYNKADAIMLSGETAYGCYALEAVQTMSKIAIEVENSYDYWANLPSNMNIDERSSFISKMAVESASMLNAKAIVADSATGKSILNMASFRGLKPILAFCYDKAIVRVLSLSFGVFADFIEETMNSQKFVINAVSKLVKENVVENTDLVVVASGNYGIEYGKSFIEISPVDKLINQVY
jgi:pyruvate kinase